MLAINTQRQVAIYTFVITAIAVATTSSFVYLATFHLLRGPAFGFAMLLATGLPLVIAPPIAFLALTLARRVSLALEKIEAFVKFDTLTGVLARGYFMDTVRTRIGEGGCFMLIDADHFKKVNDTFGHDVGDEALKTVGRVLNVAAPKEGLIGRIGGEEFGIFLPRANIDAAKATASHICEAIRHDGQTVAGKDVNLTLSIGIAMIEAGSSLTLIYKEADDLLYLAKRNGRDRYVLGKEVEGSPLPFRRAS